MSKRSQRRKRRQQKNHPKPPMGQKERHAKKNKHNQSNKTPSADVNAVHSIGIESKKNSTGKKEPVEVIETVRHFTETIKNPKPVTTTSKNTALPETQPVIVPQTINNTYARKYYKVVRKPSNWATSDCKFIGQIGECTATHWKHGAKLEFSTGEKIFIGFDALQLATNPKAATVRIPLPLHMIESIEPVSSNEPKKGNHYKVIKKPTVWKVPCKFLNHTGKCILIDDRGVRLRFENGADVSFPADCLQEVPAMDLNEKSSKNGINEENVEFGDMFRVISKPDNLPDHGDKLVGKIGKTQWVNYRGVCLKFEDGGGYVINFENLERIDEHPTIENPVKVPEKLNSNNIVFGRKYKFAKLFPEFKGSPSLLGKMVEIKWASYLSGARCVFATGEEFSIPFECLEDLPRPTESELIELIRKNPHRILRIIKGLEKITKLRPVQDFVRKGILPQFVPAPTPVEGAATETFGPQVPVCMSSEATYYGRSDEERDRENRAMALIGPIKSETENAS